MPRNITSMDVAALKGPAGLSLCGAEALSALSALDASEFEAAGAEGSGSEPEPEPEVGGSQEGDSETLQESYLRAEVLFRQISGSSLPSIDAGLQKLVKQCLAKLAACRSKISAENVFSPNEEADDIKTSSLKYLLVPHLTADVMLRQATPGGAVDRLKLLGPALAEWNVFLTECETKGLVPPAELKVLQREEGARLDAAAARDEKIARLKADKADTEKERQLIMRRRAIMAAARGDEHLAEDDSELEEVERELSKLQLSKAVRSALNQTVQVKEELEMLKMMAGRAPPPRQADDRRSARPTPQPMVRIDKDSSMGLSSRLMQQMAVQQQLYNPKLGYTMMPEEWAEQEMALNEQKQHAEIVAKHEHSMEQNMTFGVANGAQTNEEGRTVAYSEGQEEDEEQKEMKDRAWDDWKDLPGNRKGSGNTSKNSSGVSC
jgi:immunoglobulin-binding protein 1